MAGTGIAAAAWSVPQVVATRAAAAAGSCAVTYISDFAAAGSITLGGTTVSYTHGGVGGAVPHASMGGAFGAYPDRTIIGALNSEDADTNPTQLDHYTWMSVSFSSAVQPGSSLGMSDIDGAANNYEIGAIIGFNGTTPVVPGYATGTALVAGTRTVAVSPSGVTLPSPLDVVVGNAGGNQAVDAPAGEFYATFGTASVTSVYFLWAISPTVVVNGSQLAAVVDNDLSSFVC